MRLINSIALIIFILPMGQLALGAAPAAVPDFASQAPVAMNLRAYTSENLVFQPGYRMTGSVRARSGVPGSIAVSTAETSCTGPDCGMSGWRENKPFDNAVVAPFPISEILALLGLGFVGLSVVARR